MYKMAFGHLNHPTHLRHHLCSCFLDHPLNPSLLFNSSSRFFNPKLTFYNQRKMSRRNGGRKLDLKLNLSPPTGHRRLDQESPSRSATVSPTNSCVSSETELRYSSSPEATSMMLVGCPRCLMYVMLAEEYPKCPKCKSTVLLDVLHNNSTKKTRKI